MAIDITIKNKKIFKKNITIQDIIFENMRYGVMDDAYRLVENKSGNYMVVFNECNYSRGYELSIKEDTINLSLPIPTSEKEINFFYEYVQFICNKLHIKTFIRENNDATFDKISKYIEEDIKLSKDTLNQMITDINNDKYKNIYLFGALNPIALGKEELMKINGDLNKLGSFMYDCQSMDVYYAKANIYKRNDNTIFGVYVLTQDIPSVLPYEAHIFMNDDIKVDSWNIAFVIDEKLTGTIPYEVFLDNVDKSNVYDNTHFIVKLNKGIMESLIDKYKIDL